MNRPPLSPVISEYLSGFLKRSRRMTALRAAGWAAALFGTWVLLWCGIDRLLHLNSSVRLAAGLMGVVVALLILLWPQRMRRRPVDWVATAAMAEQQDPRFEQRLITVTSRLLGAPEHRGSDEILSQLLREVERAAADAPGPPVKTRWRVIRPWLAVAAVVAGGAALLTLPDLGMPRLLLRFARPFSDVPPVTTTQLNVSPGRDVDLGQSEPTRIEAEVQRFGGSAVSLFISGEDQSWSRMTMEPAGEGRFGVTLAAVDRDTRYYVTAGDATSPQYALRVLRRPLAKWFQVRYVYPSFTRREPATVTNTDGLIEAPAGTEATLLVAATEPLQSALLSVGNEKILMRPTADPAVAQARLVVQRDVHYALDMISTRNVPGGGPAGPDAMQIRATPDRPPAVRLLQPQAGSRVRPHEIVPLEYEATDDYGLDWLLLRTQINASTPVETPLPVSGNARGQHDVFRLDLALLNPEPGDLLAVTLHAKDTAGQSAATEPMQFLISSHALGLPAYARITEMVSAAHYAGMVADEMEAASSPIDAAATRTGGDADTISIAQVSRHFSAASELAVLLRQTLLRAIRQNTSPQLSMALANWVDASQVQSAWAALLFRRCRETAASPLMRDESARAFAQSRDLFAQLRTATEGELAGELLADRDDLAAEENRAAPAAKIDERAKQAMRHVREELEAGARQIRLDPAAPDFQSQLEERIRARDTLAADFRPVDFGAAAEEWATRIVEDPHARLALDDRLAAASLAEAFRDDGDLSIARDLNVASHAASALEARAGSIAGVPFAVFAVSMADLQREHQLRRGAARKSERNIETFNAAAAAREKMLAWAGEQALVAPTLPSGMSPLNPRRLEAIAFAANAEAAAGNYSASARLDDSLAAELSAGSPIASGTAAAVASRYLKMIDRSMSAVRRLDAIRLAQDQLSNETRNASPQRAAELAQRQRELAGEIDVQRLATRTPPLLASQTAPATREQPTPSPGVAEAGPDGSPGHDPLEMANRDAAAAAAALSQSPPNLASAEAGQARVVDALARAWYREIHAAAADRLAALPSMQSIVAPIAAFAHLSAGRSAPFASSLAADHSSGRPGIGADGSASSALHEPSVPGYEEPLRLYFEALGKAENGKK